MTRNLNTVNKSSINEHFLRKKISPNKSFLVYSKSEDTTRVGQYVRPAVYTRTFESRGRS